ncbi:MAG: alpha/beta hydrolase [Myxococcales bacterium]|nr:alpha/beta hydrolase [Myxococcales bacterium]
MDTTADLLRAEPDPSVTTATRAAVAPELAALDRQLGGIVVNGWTYRVLRLLTSFLLPKADTHGTTITTEPSAGQGMQIVRPDTVTASGAVLLIHGGGFVVGSNREVAGPAAFLARECGVPVFCPAYRLAPQHPFPAGLDDCHAAWRWLQDQAETLDIDPSKIVIGGISAGGGHAAALAQRLHDEGGTQPAAQLLVYPMLDDRTAARRDLDKPRHRVWSNGNNLFGWTSYLGHAPGEPSPPYAVPARREDMAGLPPAWIGVGTPDLFLDEDREYARRLTEAGVDVTFVEVDGGLHGFDMAPSSLAAAFDASKATFCRRFV